MRKRTLFGVGLIVLFHHILRSGSKYKRNVHYKSVRLPGNK
ncbi:MAG TPA: hypothetical protein VN420_00300 [Candidatus Fimivivens sp.]|nr:hypothetical protein [Candidatus Fimivivens sp.]